MLTRLITASALAGGLLMVMLQAPAQALPAAKTDAVNSSAVTLAGHRGPGGGGGGIRMGGGGEADSKWEAAVVAAASRWEAAAGRSSAVEVLSSAAAEAAGRSSTAGSGLGEAEAEAARSTAAAGRSSTAASGLGGYGGGGNGPKGWPGKKFSGDYKDYGKHRGNHHRKFRGYAFYGYPYFYGYSGYSSCDWLYRRAINTGSPYWWDRYYACRDGYYDY